MRNLLVNTVKKGSVVFPSHTAPLTATSGAGKENLRALLSGQVTIVMNLW
jgi:hypothetical protein